MLEKSKVVHNLSKSGTRVKAAACIDSNFFWRSDKLQTQNVGDSLNIGDEQH
jgi:hypothetical protein